MRWFLEVHRMQAAVQITRQAALVKRWNLGEGRVFPNDLALKTFPWALL